MSRTGSSGARKNFTQKDQSMKEDQKQDLQMLVWRLRPLLCLPLQFFCFMGWPRVREGSGTILTTYHEHWHSVPHDGT